MAADQENTTSSNNMVSSSTGGYSCYSDQLQSFHDHQSNNPTEIYNLTTSMEMIGFPPNKNLDTDSLLWKGFLFSSKTTGGNHHPDSGGPPSSSKAAAVAINEPTTSHDFYQQLQQHEHDHEQYMTTKPDHNFTSENNLMQVAPADSSRTWHDDENNNRLIVDDNDPSNMRSCHVFPCGANERPSQGLSLSLSSNNPSTIGLQSFELRHQQQAQDHMRFFGSKPMNNIQHHQQQMMQEDGFLGKGAANNILQFHHQAGPGQLQIRSSKYLGPAQELLNEFCNLGTNNKQSQDHHHQESKLHKSNQWDQDDDQNIGSSSSSKKHSLYSLEFLELQKRKTKLLQMLEEVDRRYKHYCDQMKAVVYSFEAMAGNGAATVYSALASKAMSRHFRCLRDGIVGQIKATKKAMGEKDTAAAPGGTRGETPRLRVLDQTLRQQRAFQQMNMMENHPWRPQRGLPERSVSVLRAWLFEHFLHPYPSDVDKHILARQTGLSRSQVSNWFINARVRLWKPMVEEMYLEETKEHDNMVSSDGVTTLDDDNVGRLMINPNPQRRKEDDQKPTPDQLVRIDSECLSSIINNPEKNDNSNNKQVLRDHLHHQQQHQQQHSFGRITDSFGAVELDFSSYNHHSAGAISYANDQNFNNGGGSGSGGGVSLTLGLQQHGGGGVSLAFSPTSQASLFYPRDHIEECQQVQYSLLDGEGQNLPYRNLMGAQLLHDLAG